MALTLNRLMMAISGSRPLRFVSPRNRLADSAFATNTGGAGRDTLKERVAHWIGTADRSYLVFSFTGWVISTSGANVANGNSYTIDFAALESQNLGVTVPITFGGSRSKVINDLDNDIQCDPILPSAFGLSKFTVGEKYWLRIQREVATAGQFIPCDGTINNGTGEIAYNYERATTTITSVDLTGALTNTSGANFGSGRKCAAILLGPFVTGDPPTYIGIGDSIMRDQADTGFIQGYFGRSLWDSDLVSNPKGGCNMGKSAGVASPWSSANAALLTAYCKYAKYAIESYGTNGGTLADSQAIWAACRAAGILKIGRPRILPRTTTTDLYATEPNQTYVSGYSSGGAKDLLAASMLALLGQANGPDQWFPFTAMCGVDTWKWVVTGANNFATTDGLHPGPNTHPLAAVDVRTWMGTLT